MRWELRKWNDGSRAQGSVCLQYRSCVDLELTFNTSFAIIYGPAKCNVCGSHTLEMTNCMVTLNVCGHCVNSDINNGTTLTEDQIVSIQLAEFNNTSSMTPSSTTTPPTGSPTAVQTASPYTLQGCQTDNDDNNRALSQTSVFNDSITVEVCAAFCSAAGGNGTFYMGVEYGKKKILFCSRN